MRNLRGVKQKREEDLADCLSELNGNKLSVSQKRVTLVVEVTAAITYHTLTFRIRMRG